jgi:hypothetical protein
VDGAELIPLARAEGAELITSANELAESFSPPTPTAEALSLSCPPSASFASGSVMVSGSLSPALAGAPIVLTYTPNVGSPATHTVTTDAAGNYSDTYVLPKASSVAVNASYGGDAKHQGASANCSITISS